MGLTDNPDDSGIGRLGSISHGISVESFPKPKNNAGRDLPVAISVGVLLGLLVILSVWIGPYAWYPLVAAAVALSMWEVITRLREHSYVLPRSMTMLLGQLIVWLSWPLGATGVLGGFTIAVLFLMFGRLFHHGRKIAPQNYLRDTAVGIFVLAWIPMFGAFAAMLSLMSRFNVPSSFYIITFMVCVVASDTGGYIAGVFFGSRPMAPAVSPKKSWEGAAGSLFAGIVAGVLTVTFLLGEPWWLGVILGAALVVCATMGDLVESQFKREIHIKDMSGLLPGHGGLMDRLDGMLPSAAVTWLVLSALSTGV